MRADEEFLGMIWVHEMNPIGNSIEEILIVCECYEMEEMRDQIVYLPL